MAKPFTVKLVRGKLDPVQWAHEFRTEAWRRASALAELHGTTVDEGESIYVVDASNYYGRDE